MAKKGLHPEFHKESEVICNGEVVYTISGTKERYDVDLWSGNHPFYQGKKGANILSNDGQASTHTHTVVFPKHTAQTADV